MYIPNPYFPNIPQLGNLILDYIFVEDGHPLLFVCKNNSKLYLCICRTTTPEQKWIMSEVNIGILLEMTKRKITIADAFRRANKISCIAKWSKANPNEQYNVFPTSELQDSDLPNSNLYLSEDDAEDAMDYVEGLILQETNKLIAQLQSTELHRIAPLKTQVIFNNSYPGASMFQPPQPVYYSTSQCLGNAIRYADLQQAKVSEGYNNMTDSLKIPVVA